MSHTIRHATVPDIEAVTQMYAHSRSLMRAAGNTMQWVGYPTDADVRADIEAETSYIVEDEGRAIGTFALVPGVEHTYGVIDHGRWVEPARPYSTVHRLAKAQDIKGLWPKVFAFCRERCDYMRADTHETNAAMRHLLEGSGFVHCGTVYMDDGAPRLAYEWWRYDEVPADLQHYVEQHIIPQYHAFDTAHRENHVRRVIARAMAYEPSAAIYTAAAMHDLGLAFGREEHHLYSGHIIREDRELRRWFSEAEIEQIAQAAEDHRASAKEPPRSRLGAIVAEADRDVEPLTIVQRTVQFGLSHYPELDREGHWQRTLQHLDEKYSEHGYIRLWLSDSPNREPLAELRALIRDRVRLRSLFCKYFDNK